MGQAHAHIGLDAHLLSTREDYRAAGVSRYIYHLLRALPAVAPNLRYTAYLGFRCPELPEAVRQSVSPWPTRRPSARILWEQIAGPIAALSGKLSLWHALVNVQPLLLRIPAIITIQDLSFLAYPERFRRGNRLYNQIMVRLSARRARHIIVTSHSTKQDVIRCYGIAPNRISVTYLAADETLHPIEDQSALAAFRASKALPEHLILYVGTIEPRKNLDRLVRAFGELKRRSRLPHHLVIGGGKGWLYDQVYATVQELGLQGEVHFPGFVPQPELVWWYNCADVMAYPSLYEGFGLPPLEAMSCGTPVVTSNVSSLPEIVGEAALTADPYDVDALAEALYVALTDEARRAEMRQAGLARAAAFSWERTARDTVHVYELVLRGEAMTDV